MAEIRAGAHVVQIDDEDLVLVEGLAWHLSKRGYVAVRLRRRALSLHRLVAGARTGQHVDHINGNKLDNRKANLRICTHAENMRNRARHSNNTSGYKGVSRRKGENRWGASIQVGGRLKRVGSYTSPIAAALAYDRAAQEHYGAFARPNFSPDRDWLLICAEVAPAWPPSPGPDNYLAARA